MLSKAASPWAIRSDSFWKWLMRGWMVWKLVSVPPSQRLLMNGMPHRSASCSTMRRACFFVPTNRTCSPDETTSRTFSTASSRARTVFARSRMWMPLRAVKMYRPMWGFQRRVW